MSLLSAFIASQDVKSGRMRATLQAIYIFILAFSIFLAIKDLNLLQHTSTKVWVMILAIFMPELYVILHGISTSSMSVNFFSGSPVESQYHHSSNDDHVMSKIKSAISKSSDAPPAAPSTMSTSSPTDTSSSLF